MARTSVFSIPLDEKTEARLAETAARMGQSPADLAARAIEAFLDVQAWHIAEIETAVKSADAGAFATDDELATAKVRWTS